MNGEIPQEDPSGNKPKTKQGKQTPSYMRYAPRPLSMDMLKEGAEAARQAGYIQEAEALQKIIDKPEPSPNSSISTPNQAPVQSSVPHKDVPTTIWPNYPAGQGVQNLENIPVPPTPKTSSRGNQREQNQPPSNAPKGPTPSGGK